jgi:hypothetical protein
VFYLIVLNFKEFIEEPNTFFIFVKQHAHNFFYENLATFLDRIINENHNNKQIIYIKKSISKAI